MYIYHSLALEKSCTYLVKATTPCFETLYPTSSKGASRPLGGLTLSPAPEAMLIIRPPGPP